MEVGHDIEESKETGSKESPSGQIDPGNGHYPNCVRREELSKRGVANIINRCAINSAEKLKCCTNSDV